MTTPAPPDQHSLTPTPRGWRALILATAAPAAALLAALASPPLGLTTPASIMLAILLLAAILWISEAITPLATSLLVIALCVALLGLPAEFGAAWMTPPPPHHPTTITGWEVFIAPAGSGIMLLLLGSMTLGVAIHQTRLDSRVGARVLAPFMSSARRLALGLMLTSAFMALWMSNTATAAIMLAVARGLAPRFQSADLPTGRVAAGLALAVALGANVGGIGSPVGTPPSAIVFTRLKDMGQPISFAGWMALGVPIACLVLAAGWFAMTRLLKLPPNTPQAAQPSVHAGPTPNTPLDHAAPAHDTPWARRLTAGVFLCTLTLWLTGGASGIPVEVAALLPLAILPVAGIITARDLALVDWDVLLLILGGLVLGVGMETSGLAQQLVDTIPLQGLSPPLVVALAALAALVLSAFISNTATANLLAPIAMGIAASITPTTPDGAPGDTNLALAVGFAIALGAGASMQVVVATPANAMAARDGVTAPHFLIVGTIVGVAVLLVVTALAGILA